MSQRRIGILSQLCPPKATWTAWNVPDQTGKIAIITYGHFGIGKETARVLLSKGAKVYIACPDAKMAQDVIDELKDYTERDSIFFLMLDLADLTSIKAAAQEFLRKESELHTLYNNANITVAPDETTEQGYDLIFGINVLGHFYLTKLLLPLLVTTAKKSRPGTIRVINVSSIVHYLAAREGIRWATLGPEKDAPAARRKLGTTRIYGQSKLGNILFSNELARRYKDEGIVSISHYPGPGTAKNHPIYEFTLSRLAMRLVGWCIRVTLSGGILKALAGDLIKNENCYCTRGARKQAELLLTQPELPHLDEESTEPTDEYRAITTLYAGTAPKAGRLSGKVVYLASRFVPDLTTYRIRIIPFQYLTAWARVSLPSKQGLRVRVAEKLWDWCEDEIKEVQG